MKLPIRRTPMHSKKYLRQKMGKFSKHKLITPCHSPHSSPAMLATKKNVELRLVIDYRQLSMHTVESFWPLPSFEEIFGTWELICYSETFDMSRGFYQLPFEKISQDYRALSNPFGSFKWIVSPMDLTGSPPVFHSLMENVLIGLAWNIKFPYFEHIERLRQVFQRFRDVNLKIIPLKCEFFNNMYFSWVTFLVDMEIMTIQLKHLLCASIQYRIRLECLKIS